MDIIFMDSTTVKVHRHGIGVLKKDDRKVYVRMLLVRFQKYTL